MKLMKLNFKQMNKKLIWGAKNNKALTLYQTLKIKNQLIQNTPNYFAFTYSFTL